MLLQLFLQDPNLRLMLATGHVQFELFMTTMMRMPVRLLLVPVESVIHGYAHLL
jgi:hypothetical protein